MTDYATTGAVAEQAEEFVSARFIEAKNYARDAWDEANSYLEQLVNTVMHPSIDTNISVPFNYTGSSLVISNHGDKPTVPTFNTSFNFSKPVLGNLKVLPEIEIYNTDFDTLKSNIITRLLDVIKNGATGLDADVEQAIFDRAKSRQELDNIRLYTEAEQYFSVRGFEMPTGAMAGRLQEINIEIARNNSNLNNDVMIEQAKLAQTNFQFVLEKGATIVTDMIELSFKVVLDYNKGTIDTFIAEAEAYKQEINSILSEIEAKSKVYTAEADVYKANASVDNADIAAQIEIAKLSLGEAQIKSELAIKEVDIELEAAMKLHQLQVAAFESGSKVTSQIVASSLAAVNASANFGFSGNVGSSQSGNYSYDMTKENIPGAQTSYVHTYKEI